MKRVVTPLMILIFSALLFAQEWEIVKMGNMEFYPNDGYAFNMDTAMYVGQDGAVLITTDGGQEGMLVREPDGNSWTAVDFANELVGYACAGAGFIYKTTDGGYTWTQVGDTANITTDLKGIAVVSEDTVYVAGRSSTLLKTVDGGATWEASTFDFGKDLDGGIDFCNANVGVVASDSKGGYTWYTHDGGVTWTSSIVTFPTGTGSQKIFDVSATGDSTFVLAGYGYTVFISTDGGQNWQVSGDYVSDYVYNYKAFTVDENTFFVGGQNGHLVKTTDGGATWTNIDIPTGQKIQFMHFVDADNGFVFAQYGQWFKTFDGGQSWTPLLEWPNVTFKGMGFSEPDHIFATGWAGEYTMTSDGYNWTYPDNKKTGSTEKIYAVEFISPTVGFLGGTEGLLLKTTDGGETWAEVSNPMYDDQKSIYVVKQIGQKLYAGGRSGYVMVSDDNGDTWSLIPNSSTSSVYDFWQASDTLLVAVGSSGKIFYSTSAIDSFYVFKDHGSMTWREIDATAGHVVLVGSKGYVYHTTPDKPDSLQEVFKEPAGKDLYGLAAVDDTTFYIGGRDGVLYVSTDGGLTWAAETLPEDAQGQTIERVIFDGASLWLTGNDGNILKKSLTPAGPISGLFINEFMASNDNAYADENGEFDDWIEFYNNTDQPIDMGGLLINDDLNEPFSSWYMIPDTAPDSTTVQPGGFILFWADKQSEQGVLHLEIKLSSSGEQIGLAQIVGMDTVMLDSITFGAQESDTSMGRRTDGADEWVKFFPSSPLDNNENGTIVSIRYEPGVVVHEYALEQNYPNPFNPVTTIKFSIKKSGPVELEVFNAAGQKVATLLNRTMKAGRVEVKWDAGNMASGLYFYRLKSGNFTAVKKMLLVK
ncbi:MAG TPA: T9SS type A sorting domain-containing protein [Caldithrix abyssi]|uniref:T9SS type A sorting domain-containing protein n=1 Tax=Caldithrix abyssi TaxID=187145 RepID=A0A7V4TYS9_CALAY|nr:T9SS type A sorting domain-containing protein [Caldithrix abyssi]